MSSRDALLTARLDRVPLAFLDLEMTGLDPKLDRVIEICIERVVGGQLTARLCALVRPDRPLCAATRSIVDIVDEQLLDQPPFSAFAAEVLALLDGAVLVAHAARHDMAFLQAEFARAAVPWPRPTYLDTLTLARRLLERPCYGLSELSSHFGIVNNRPHRADNDVALLRALFERLMAGTSATTVADAVLLSRGGTDVAAVLVAARHAAAAGKVATLSYRPRGKPPQQLSFCTTAVRADLDPPRVVGYLLPSRGQRELRADRILSFELLDP